MDLCFVLGLATQLRYQRSGSFRRCFGNYLGIGKCLFLAYPGCSDAFLVSHQLRLLKIALLIAPAPYHTRKDVRLLLSGSSSTWVE